jgi:hypothetical protein
LHAILKFSQSLLETSTKVSPLVTLTNYIMMVSILLVEEAYSKKEMLFHLMGTKNTTTKQLWYYRYNPHPITLY